MSEYLSPERRAEQLQQKEKGEKALKLAKQVSRPIFRAKATDSQWRRELKPQKPRQLTKKERILEMYDEGATKQEMQAETGLRMKTINIYLNENR